jgi:hypothetical protein
MPSTDINSAMKNMLKVGILSGRIDPFVAQQLGFDVPSVVSLQDIMQEKQAARDAMQKSAEVESKASEQLLDIKRDVLSSEMKMREDSMSNIVKGLMSERETAMDQQAEAIPQYPNNPQETE